MISLQITRLNHLNWPSLEHRDRRNFSRLTMLYKITHNLVVVVINANLHVYIIPQTTTPTRKTSPLHYQTYSTRTVYFEFRLFPHTITLWNDILYMISCSSNFLEPVQIPGPKYHFIKHKHHYVHIVFTCTLFIY